MPTINLFSLASRDHVYIVSHLGTPEWFFIQKIINFIWKPLIILDFNYLKEIASVTRKEIKKRSLTASSEIINDSGFTVIRILVKKFQRFKKM